MVLEKTVAREKFRRLRCDYASSSVVKATSDESLRIRLTSFLADQNPQTVLAYRPLKTEAHPFGSELSEEFFYPEVVGEIFHAVKNGERGAPEQLDMVLVPGIAFDRRGNRLGFGKGYYDRFLKTTRATRVGIAYSFQVSSEELECESWDEPVEWIITDRYVLHVERKDQKKWKS